MIANQHTKRSEIITIKNHEWRAVLRDDNTISGYEFRRVGDYTICPNADAAGWQGHRQWPHYDLNNGMTLGLPKGLSAFSRNLKKRVP